ncbi:MAG: lysine--tRNA ligase, partial [Candidatus Bathyarchaeia archaeon]
IEYAFNWTRDFMEIRERAVKLSEKEAAAVRELIQALQVEAEEDQIQGAVFNIARKHSIPPKRFFKTLYNLLLGMPEGPRLGPYIVAMGRRNVTDALKRALKK